MYNKQRSAIDVRGNPIEITESQGSESIVGHDGSVNYKTPAAFFDPYGKRLIPEGKGFFRSPWGMCYQLVD
jgi:hypothetical protein